MKHALSFVKKPIVVEAIQWDGKNTQAVERFVGKKLDMEQDISYLNDGEITLLIPTLESPHEASVGDWIIKGIKGEFYPCKPDIFELTYEVWK